MSRAVPKKGPEEFLPVKMVLAGVEYSFNQAAGKWVSKVVGSPHMELDMDISSKSNMKKSKISDLERKIEQTQKALAEMKQQNEFTKKKIDENKLKGKDLEEITIAETIEVQKLKQYRDKIVQLKDEYPDVI